MTVTTGLFAVGWLVVAIRIGWLILSKQAGSASGKGAKGKGKKALRTLAKHWKELIPFLTASVAVALAGACVGGILGGLLGWGREKTGDAGDWSLNKLTGAQPITTTKPLETGALNTFGAIVMLTVIVIACMAWKAGNDIAKKEIAWGTVCGLALGPFVGAVALVPTANWVADNSIGALFYGTLG